jgi:hypothetical protein
VIDLNSRSKAACYFIFFPLLKLLGFDVKPVDSLSEQFYGLNDGALF